MSSKIKLLIIGAVILIVIGTISFFIFKKIYYSPPAVPPSVVLPAKIDEDKNLIIQRATQFAGQYGSYPWGEFFHIEILYDMMSEKLRKEMIEFVAREKEEIKKQPAKWLYFNTIINGSKIINHTSEAAEVEIEAIQYSLLEKKEVVGEEGFDCTKFKSLDDCTNPEINPIAALIFEKTKKEQIINVKMLKEDNIWKIDEISIKSK